jgi:outer membrane protein
MMTRRLRYVGLSLVLCSTAMPAVAETLQEALTKAYQTNPTLAGARAGQRANDENVTIAKARM